MTLHLITEKEFVLSMNNRGFDIAITTIILIIIGIAVLIGLILFVRNGFDMFSSGTDPILKASNFDAAIQACQLLCKSENSIAFCCESINLDGDKVFCSDERLDVKCNINCAAVSCLAS